MDVHDLDATFWCAPDINGSLALTARDFLGQERTSGSWRPGRFLGPAKLQTVFRVELCRSQAIPQCERWDSGRAATYFNFNWRHGCLVDFVLRAGPELVRT